MEAVALSPTIVISHLAFTAAMKRIAIVSSRFVVAVAGWLASLRREFAKRMIGRAKREGPEALRDFLLAQILLHEGRK